MGELLFGDMLHYGVVNHASSRQNILWSIYAANSVLKTFKNNETVPIYEVGEGLT